MDQVTRQVRHWRDELLNLSRRDRVLYYKPTKTASIEVLQPAASEVLERLLKAKSGWRFYEPPVLEGDDGSMPPPARASDELLTQKDEATKLAAGLRTLGRRTTEEFMDKGLWVLYLAVGFLHWRDPDTEDEVRSPVLLIPVSVHPDSPREPARLRLADEDPVVNPALAVYMDGQFGVKLPKAPELEDLELNTFLAEVSTSIRGQKDWHVKPALVVDVFSFHKEAMYRDLEENEAEVVANEVIQALALGAESDVPLAFVPPDEAELDQRYPSERMSTIRDADASQRKCVVVSQQGRSFVMDGPPGTGKSQTISNIIAQAMADGQTVLFVSEKIAALDVVKSRLDAVGLGDFLLELHSHKATRKQVAQALYTGLTNVPSVAASMRDADVDRLVAAREELSAYADAMNEPRKVGMSLHTAIGRVVAASHLPQAPLLAGDPGTLDSERLQEISSTAEAMSRVWGPVSRGDGFTWRGARTEFASTGAQQDVRARLDRGRQSIVGLGHTANQVSQDLELWWNSSPAQANQLLEILEILGDRRDVPEFWLTADSFDPVLAEIGILKDSSNLHRDAVETLKAFGDDEVWRSVSTDLVGRYNSSLDSLRSSVLGWPTTDDTLSSSVSRSFEFAQSELLRRIGDDFDELADLMGLRYSRPTLGVALDLTELAGLAGNSHAPEAEWLDEIVLTRVQTAAGVLGALVESYRAKAEQLGDIYRPSVLQLDIHALKVRFETLHTGVRKIGSARRADKRLLAEHTVTGKASKEAIAALGDVLEWHQVSETLAKAERQHADQLGPFYYSGPGSSFEDIAAAIEVARQATALAGDVLADRARFTSQVGRGGTVQPRVKELRKSISDSVDAWLNLATQALTQSRSDLMALSLDSISDEVRSAVDPLGSLVSICNEVQALTESPLTLGKIEMAIEARSRLAEIEDSFQRFEPANRALVGSRYDGLATDWEEVAADAEWALSLRPATSAPVDEVTANRLLTTSLAADVLREPLKDWAEARDGIADLFVGERSEEISNELDANYGDSQDLLDTLEASLIDIDEWAQYVARKNRLAELGLSDAVEWARDQRLDAAQLPRIFERATLEAWIDALLDTDPRLGRVRSKDRDAMVEEFRRLDHQLIDTGTSKVMRSVNARRPQTGIGATGIIVKEGQKKTRHMPVRDLLSQTKDVAQAIKPCFMMSPLSVSQFLSPDMRFDLVIFDEASQVRPSDAINCVYRGDQVIIAGDQRQLPPTDFFQKVAVDGGDGYQDDQFDEFESVLDLAKAGGMESLPLRWHYRSQHEDLITYSNYSFYEGRLVTFPGAANSSPDVGVELFHVDGVYRRGGARDNPIEAAKVAERVMFHARNHPDLTLGVVAFSEAQASTIAYTIDQKRADHPELDGFFGEDRLDGFFVKNLESVQGDERDIMIFSVGFGPDEFGKVTMNFGPLNRPGGERRLNVAITRARRRVEVVSSILPEHFTPTQANGPRHLQRYLDFAKRGAAALALDVSSSDLDAESPFEEEVIRVLRSWGYEARPQVGVAAFRVDIGVVDPAAPGRFVLGVECDGAMYHSSRVARDRDRLRQEVLEGLGWTIHRVWGPSWYRDRPGAEKLLRDAIERASNGMGARSPRTERLAPAVEYASADLDAPPDWTVEYQVCRPRVADWREMADPASTPDIARAIEEVVRVEGPVSQEVVLRRVREAWGLKSSGKRVRAAFEGGLRIALTKGVTKDRKNFLSRGQQPKVLVRRPTEDPDSKRKVDEVSDQELAEAVAQLIQDAKQVAWDELSSAVAGIFGWARRGPLISDRLDSIVNGLLKSERISSENGFLRA